MNQIPKHIVDLARENRKNLTQQEFVAWQRLRGRKYRGLKFLRQHPLIYFWSKEDVHFFIADFYCHELKLVVEIDGGYHNLQPELDQWRDEVIQELGLKTLRIKNEDAGDVYRILDEYLADK
jgi:very-short-patch-repair endonuclease